MVSLVQLMWALISVLMPSSPSISSAVLFSILSCPILMGAQSHSFTHAKQTFYHWPVSPNLLFVFLPGEYAYVHSNQLDFDNTSILHRPDGNCILYLRWTKRAYFTHSSQIHHGLKCHRQRKSFNLKRVEKI